MMQEETIGIKTMRHRALDLFESAEDHSQRPDDWFEVHFDQERPFKYKNPLPKYSCHVEVKRKNGSIARCAFWEDKHEHLQRHAFKTSYFQDLNTYHFYHDVTHWRYYKPKLP